MKKELIKEPRTLAEMCDLEKGLCCEKRTRPSLMKEDIKIVIAEGLESRFDISEDQTYATTKNGGDCCFFKQPNCQNYAKRPVDCQTYPVSFRLDKKENIEYIIDARCPAVLKGLVGQQFIAENINLWKKSIPSKEWARRYDSADNPEKYDFMTKEEYDEHRKMLTYFLLE